MNEKEAVLKVLDAIYALGDELGNLTEAILGDDDECPTGYEWWDEILGNTDDALVDLKIMLYKKYHIDPRRELLKAVFGRA